MMVVVEQREYARLLGYPWGTELEGQVRDLAQQAEAWYACHGNPRVYCVPGVIGVTAGSEVEVEVQNRWDDGRIDEAYFLDRYAAAVVEKLALDYGCTRRPGTSGVPFEKQFDLFAAIAPLNPEIEMLPSGMLRPKNSLLASDGGMKAPATCLPCRLANCSFRRHAS